VVSKREKLLPVIPAELDDWVANRLVSAHFRILLAFVLGHFLSVAMIAAGFFRQASSSALAGWSAAVVAVALHRLWLGTGSNAKAGRRDPQKLIRNLDLNAGALAVLIAGGIIWLMPLGGAMHQVLLAIVATTSTAAAAYTMRTLHKGAIAYTAILTAALIGSLAIRGTPEALAAAVLAGASGILLSRMALVAHALFVTRIVRERELSGSVDTVRMLLNDFEDHGSDWLFELDRDDRVLGASKRFAETLDLTSETLNGRRLITLFADTPERDALIDHLGNRRGFRGLSLPLVPAGNGAQRWWSLSGRPCAPGANSVVSYRGVISDVSSEKQAEERVRHMAHYDGLTGLPNRLMFGASLNRMLAQGILSSRAVVMVIDIDHFKSINDAMGHPIGDHFLKAASNRLIDCVAKSGLGGEGQIIARLGGDEFAILMAGEDAADHAIRLSQTIIDRMSQPFLVQDQPIQSGVSIGLAISPFDGEDGDELLRSAGLALQRAKQEGRGCWERFETGLDVAVRQRHALERDLRTALGRDEMQLHYQPLVDIQSGKHVGFEALLRWQNAERGMVMPDDFIPIAEETGLIVPLGEWVIRSAMREAAQWQEPLTIAVNVSPVQMRSPNLLPTIMNSLAETGIDPSRFEVEITEGVLLNDSEANMAVLHRMHDLGIRIALDDFGTGYASLNYLRTFPFDKIKIDRSFVNDLDTREDARAIVSAVIALAHNLGMVTLAEGVEHDAQLAELKLEGCGQVQGWLFGKAMPVEHFEELRPAKKLKGRRAA